MKLLPIAVGLVFVILACAGSQTEQDLECVDPTGSAKPTQWSCPTYETKQILIAEVLFDLERGEGKHRTNYDYNNYNDEDCPPDKDCSLDGDCGYRGGHSGWDVQTTSVAGDSTADERFHSLTSGQVTATDEALGMVAVYDADKDKTTVYLHARKIFVDTATKKNVEVGTALGIQGNAGLGYRDTNTREHVHIEVQDGWSDLYSCGAGETVERPGIDPIDYLYKSAVVAQQQ